MAAQQALVDGAVMQIGEVDFANLPLELLFLLDSNFAISPVPEATSINFDPG